MTLTRLDDREQRTGRTFFRKRVFLKKTDDVKSIVIEFHPNYETIYKNYLRAIELTPATYVGKMYTHDDAALILEAEYLGQPLPSGIASMARAFEVLKNINVHNSYNHTYSIPRYITEVSKTSNDNLPYLSKLNHELSSHPIQTTVGLGVEDPALSNFVENNGKTYLVDLDNFDTKYNLDSMLGFLITESHIENIFSITTEILVDDAQAIYSQVNVGLMLCGAIGRLAVVVIDKEIEDPAEVAYAERLLEELSQQTLRLLY